MNKIIEWIKVNIWWEITQFYYWYIAMRTEEDIIDKENDLYVSSSDKYDYYQRDNIKGRIYRVKRKKGDNNEMYY